MSLFAENAMSVFIHKLMHTLQTVGFSFRVEIACICSVAVLWAVTSLLNSRRFRLVDKKSGEAVRRSAPACRSSSTSAARCRKGGEKRAPSQSADDLDFSTIFPEDVCADPARLVDASWVVPRIVMLCRTHVGRAVHVFRCSMRAGLDLQRVPMADREQMVVSMVTATIRVHQADEALQLLRELRKSGYEISAEICASVTKLCTSKQLFADCLAIFDFLAEDATLASSQDRSVWSCLLLCSVESGALHRCRGFFDALSRTGVPSQRDYWNMVKSGSLQGDWKLLLRLLSDMRSNDVEIGSIVYNTVLAACVAADQIPEARTLLDEMQAMGDTVDVITYNTLMKGYAKLGAINECFECYTSMTKANIEPSPVTYGILLDSCVSGNQVDRAAEVFSSMTAANIPMNTVLYTTLIKGFARIGKVAEAMSVYEKMQADSNVSPDLITYSILIKANCDASRLAEALQLLDAMLKSGLQPDEVVFNNLLAGCAKQANAELALRLYKDMVASKVAPSNATFSIMIGLYSSCKLFDEAVAMLREEPAIHGVELEPRLFAQLLQCCIRARHGRRALEAYHLLHEHSSPSAAVHNSIFVLCVKLNMFDTAADILAVAAEKGGHVDARDANHVLEGALRKQKLKCVEACLKAMDTLGLTVEPKLAPRISAAVR